MFPGKAKIAAFIARITPLRIVIFLACSYLIFTTAYFVLSGLSNGLNMDTYAADGTFQLYNPMRRLLAGEIIGKDFPFFHGVGVPLLHFPLFYLLGHNVFAADAAKWLVSPLVFLVTSFMFFWGFSRKVGHSLVATVLLTIVTLVCVDVVWPGNSLLGIRTTFPVIVAAFMLWQPGWAIRTRQRTIYLYHPLVFILLALAVACGTEQGLAAIIAYMIIEIIRAIRSMTSIKQWWWRIAIKSAGVAIATYIVLSILTLGHAVGALRYALIDIPKDQGWYFGAPPNNFLSWDTLNYIFDVRVLVYLAPIILLGAVAFSIGIWRKLLSRQELYVFSFLIVYGIVVFCVSITGYWAPGAQLVPLTRVFSLVLLAIVVRIALSYIMHHKNIKQSKFQWLSFTIYTLLFITFSWYVVLVLKQVRSLPVRHVITQVRDARHAPDGTYASIKWKQRIAAFSSYIPQGASIWSTYTGVYDSIHGQLNGSTDGEDYVIHALGPERRQRYTQDFIEQKPDYAITLRPAYFPYEEWLWITSWDFYKQLFENYTIIKDNDSHILWKRNKDIEEPTPSESSNVAQQNNGSYRITAPPSDTIRLYEATVSYNIIKPIPMSDKLSRYLLSIGTPSIQRLDISLPGYEHSWTFPIILMPGQSELTLTPHTSGIIYGQGLDVTAIHYREITLPHENTYPFYDDLCLYGEPRPYNISCNSDQLGFNYYNSKRDIEIFNLPSLKTN